MAILFTNVRTAPYVDFSSGGMPFVCQPPAPGFALVGLAVRAGTWIDHVMPIFAELLEDGRLGPPIHGQGFGGHGGILQELRCAPGYVVTGIQTRSGSFVDAVRLHQTRWDGSLQADDCGWTAWIGGAGGVERPERLAEPIGSAVVVGLAGRAGAFVDNLTFMMAEPVRVAATATSKGATRTQKAALG